MTKIKIIVSAYYKFNINKQTKELTATLLAEKKFTCLNYIKLTRHYIFINLNVVYMFSKAHIIFSGFCHDIEHNGNVFSKQ